MNNRQRNENLAKASLNYAREYIQKSTSELAFTNEQADQEYFKLAKGFTTVRNLKKNMIKDRMDDKALVDTNKHIYDCDVRIEQTKKYSLGNCNEFAYVALDFIVRLAPDVTGEVFTIENGNHAFLVIGRKEGSDPKDPTTWGNDAYICDPLANASYQALEFKKYLKAYRTDPENSKHYMEELGKQHRLIADPIENSNLLGMRNSSEYLASMVDFFKIKQDLIYDDLTKFKSDLMEILKEINPKNSKYSIIKNKIESLTSLLLEFDNSKNSLQTNLSAMLEKNQGWKGSSNLNENDPYHEVKLFLTAKLHDLSEKIRPLLSFEQTDLEILHKSKLPNLFGNKLIEKLQNALNKLVLKLNNINYEAQEEYANFKYKQLTKSF